jgi:hypothetical protein
MEYVKPQVVGLDQAIDAIQALGPKNLSAPDAQDANASSATAYEADE